MSANRSSTTKIVLRLLLGVAVVTATLCAAGPWDKKDFLQWSGKEIERLLFNSPWAKKVTITGGMPGGGFTGGGGAAGRGRGAGGGAPGGGGPPGAGGAAGGARGGRRGGGFGDGAMPQMVPSINLMVRFQSALPIRHALIKHNIGESTELTPQMQAFIDEEQTYYTVVVDNLPQALLRFQDNPAMLATTARLRRKGKQDIMPATVDVEQIGRAAQFQYHFARTDPITLNDKDVEFYMKLERPQRPGQGGQGQRAGGQRAGQGQRPGGQGQGQRAGQGGQRPGQGGGQRAGQGMMMIFGKEIKRKFRLKDMVYQGELAL